ncbi:thioredoxin [Microgenomates group bacterium RBG_16_45_19]|nr:MAG: thioredoxin [Microgenomates group bacterium RBG_16_45_19]
MAAVQFSDDNFNDKVIKADKPVLVDFYADWCGPCQMAAPIIDELAETYQGKVVIGKLNVDDNQLTAGQYGVMSIPTVIVFKEGKEVDRKVGYGGKTGYEELLKQVG